MTLTAQQVRHFRDSGYLRLPHVLCENLATRLGNMVRAEARSVGDGRIPGRQTKIYRLRERDPQLVDEVITHPGILGPLRALLGPNIVYVTNRHNQAAVNAPGRTGPRLHRDILQWSRALITAVVYLEEATPTNGCTYLVPGSQYLPFVGVPQPDGGGTWMDEHKELSPLMDQAVPVPMPAGGVLLFDALAFHSVGENESGQSRMSLVLGYRSNDELDEHPDRRRQIQVSGSHLYRGNDAAEPSRSTPGR